MADEKSNLGKQSKFWISSGKSWGCDSHVPGVNDVGNQRPKPKMKSGKTREVKAVIPVKQPFLVETTDYNGKSTCSDAMSTDISTLGTEISTLQARGVTLKDLCAEDKKRIANLIKELARVGEEKENAEQNLTEERQHYQKQIMTLVHQQEAILQEREEVQNRLLQYQNYIIKLQQQQQLLQQKKRRYNYPDQQPHSQHHKQKSEEDENELNSQDRKKENTKRKEKSQEKHLKKTKELPPSNDSQGGTDSDEEEQFLEQPSTHLYINESIEQSKTLEGQSINVIPPSSPPQYTRPLPHRPFTELIDKQLSKEREKLEGIEIIDEEKPEDEMKEGKPVSPEKVEIFSRFMGSKSNAAVDEGKVEIIDVKKRVNKGCEDTETKTDRRGQKKSKHPATYSGFYPPIMSSTQKSSEIGDYISMIDSVTTGPEVKDRKKRTQNKKDDVIQLIKKGKSNKYKKGKVSYNQNNNEGRFRDNDNEEGHGRILSDRLGFEAVEDENIDGKESVDIPVDKDYLLYYKKLSASERKRELLNQREALMEEQNKLKLMLMKHGQPKNVQTQQIPEKEEGKVDLEIAKTEEFCQDIITNGSEDMLENDIVISGHGVKKSGLNKAKISHHGEELQFKGHTLKGSDGDECVTYDEEDNGTAMDPVKKKLNYSLVSNTEENAATPPELDKKFLASPDYKNVKTKMSSSPNALSKMTAILHPAMVDAETSMTFINSRRSMTKEESADEALQIETNVIEKFSSPTAATKKSKESERGKRYLSESPGDKTLAVLEIINSLPENKNEPAVGYRENNTYGSRSPYHSSYVNKNINYNNKGSESTKIKRSLYNKQAKNKDDFEICLSKSSSMQKKDDIKQRNKIESEIRDLLLFDSGHNFSEQLKFRSRQRMMDDDELDIFDRAGWKEDRLNGLRKIMSARSVEGEDSEFEYDENDDSNLDDILHNVLVCSQSNTDLRLLSDDEDYNSNVIKSLNEAEKSSDFVPPRQMYSEESDILEDIFFLN